MHRPYRFAIVGGGFRSNYFLSVAKALPDVFEVTGVQVRSAEHAAVLRETWSVPVVHSAHDLRATRPDFVLVAVPRTAAPELTQEFTQHGVPVLLETPPATSADGLRALWDQVGVADLVQVAEQSVYMPGHLARSWLTSTGTIGQVTSVQVSSNHEYHAVAVIRDFLGHPFGPVEIVSRAFDAPLLDPVSFGGPTGALEPDSRQTIISLLDFDGAMGLYDFTDNQWFNPLRRPRVTVRGSRGEIAGDRVIRMYDGLVLESDFTRRTTGTEFNLEGFDLESIAFEGEFAYRNSYVGARLPDEELCVAELLQRTGAWVRDEGVAPYPLRDGSQDHLIGLAIQESAQTGKPVRVERERWAV